jgi:hypothetical protein
LARQCTEWTFLDATTGKVIDMVLAREKPLIGLKTPYSNMRFKAGAPVKPVPGACG